MWGTRKDLLFIGNFHRFFPFSPVFPGKVNHISTNPRHFPAENVDFTTISPFFPGKVNHFAANSRHFPAGNVDFTAISPFFFRESEPFCREFKALSPSPPHNTHYPQYEAFGFSGNRLVAFPETSSLFQWKQALSILAFFYFTFYRLMITFVGCFGIEIKQICLHLNC